MMQYELHCGNSKELLKNLLDDSIDAIVTDPPYELRFMGKKWDATGIAYDAELWRECLRVLKPGGHLLAFSGSRTYHRMAVAIEDAGFDIRDQIMWVYGSGFPKSLDVSKAIDKAAGAERKVIGTKLGLPGYSLTDGNGAALYGGGFGGNGTGLGECQISAPATEAAKEWNGWGTALKPAHEPICVARKPLIGTVAENVLQYGTGALNIDGCRVGAPGETINNHGESGKSNPTSFCLGARIAMQTAGQTRSRWPANLIHDGSAEVLAGFPESEPSGAAKNGRVNINGKNYAKETNIFGSGIGKQTGQLHNDRGSAARFFYCAKASKKDRDEGHQINNHPTVKPTELMQYLCRLITPPNGLILDPFTGSGSTGKAAILEGFRFIGFDMQHEYIEIAKARIEYAILKQKEIAIKKGNTLFDE